MRDPAQWRRTLGQSRWCGNRETQPEGTLLSRSLRGGSPPSLTERDYSVRSRHQKSWRCSLTGSLGILLHIESVIDRLRQPSVFNTKLEGPAVVTGSNKERHLHLL